MLPTESEKSFFSISEAAQYLNVPAHVLRFWESKFSQITPIKRRSGRRFYRKCDIQNLQKIKDLLYQQGYTIKGVQKILAHDDNNDSNQDKKILLEIYKDLQDIIHVLHDVSD